MRESLCLVLALTLSGCATKEEVYRILETQDKKIAETKAEMETSIEVLQEDILEVAANNRRSHENHVAVINGLEGRLDDVEGSLEEQGSDIRSHEEAVVAIGRRLDDVEGQVTGHNDVVRFTGLQDVYSRYRDTGEDASIYTAQEIQGLLERHDQLHNSRFTDVEGALRGLNTEVQQVKERLAALEKAVGERLSQAVKVEDLPKAVEDIVASLSAGVTEAEFKALQVQFEEHVERLNKESKELKARIDDPAVTTNSPPATVTKIFNVRVGANYGGYRRVRIRLWSGSGGWHYVR